ncbi:hypothetical protein [uncultured Gammaproteobacteria bacterium]|nr:hypothetical protein [uncultured Gammaproteobacteria bacterium]
MVGLVLSVNASHDAVYHNGTFNWNVGSNVGLAPSMSMKDAEGNLLMAQQDMVTAQAAYDLLSSSDDHALLADAHATLDAMKLAVSIAQSNILSTMKSEREARQSEHDSNFSAHSSSESGMSGGHSSSSGGHGSDNNSGGMGGGHDR